MHLKISRNANWFLFLSFDFWGEIWAECCWISIFDTVLINDWGLYCLQNVKQEQKCMLSFIESFCQHSIWNEWTACWRESFRKYVSLLQDEKQTKIQDRQIRGTALNASVSSNIIITVFRRSSSSRLLQIK